MFGPFTPADNDLEPGLFRAGDKEPRTDHQPPLRRGPLHVFQHRLHSPRHHLQGQESPPDGAALREPTAGNAGNAVMSGYILKYLLVISVLIRNVAVN